MKTKLSVIFIVSVMILIGLFGTVMAAEDISAKLNVVISPSNPEVGQNVTIEISLSELKDGVKSVSFTLDIDDDVLEILQVLAGEGWQSNVQGKTVTITTTDGQATTTTGKIATVTLKVKDDAVANTESAISLRAIQVVGESGPLEGFNDLTRTITVEESTTPGGSGAGTGGAAGNQGADEGTGSGSSGQQGETGGEGSQGENPAGGTENGGSQSGNGNGEAQGGTDGEPVVDTLPVEKINEIGGYTQEDKQPEEKEIPKTGENYAVQFAILGVSIISIVAYAFYRKNRI